MKKPIIYSVTENGENAPIFSQGIYDVFVGALEDNQLPQYVVLHRDTKVVEFTTPATGQYKDWLNFFAPPVEANEQGELFGESDTLNLTN